MLRYPDAHRALSYHSWLQELLAPIRRALDGMPQEIRPWDVSSVLDHIGSTWAMRIDQAILPCFALEISKMADQCDPTLSEAQQYSWLFTTKDGRQAVDDIVRRKYPVLYSRIYSHIQNLQQATQLAITRFSSDASSLVKRFDLKTARLDRIEATTGDSHDQGQMVLKFVLERGTRLFYKPQSTACDDLANKLYELINLPMDLRCGITDSFDRGSYGWARQIRFSPLECPDDRHRYWRRAGALMAIADLANFTDGHFENLVASGNMPTIIDNETYFQNIRQDFSAETNEEHSILFTGLIQRIGDIDRGLGYMSAYQVFGGRRIQSVFPHPVNERTPRLAVKMSGVTHSPPLNHPIYKGQYTRITDSREEFISGMEAAYHWVRSQKKRILDNALWSRIANHTARQLIRPTMYYLLLLRLIDQPDFGAKSMQELRKTLLNKLEFDPQDSDSNIPQINEIVETEIRALNQHDIPYFISRVGSRDLVSADGAVFRNFFQRSALDQMRSRIANLNIEYIERQSYIANYHLDLGLPDTILTAKERDAIKDELGEQ